MSGLILFITLNSNIFAQQLKHQINSSIGSSSRIEFVGYGEIIALQKNKGTLRVRGLEKKFKSGSIARLNEFFLVKYPKLIVRDSQNSQMGFFYTYRIESEITSEFTSPTYLLYGSFKLAQSRKRNFLTVGYQAGLYRSVAGYLPPSAGNTAMRAKTILPRLKHHIDKKEMLYIPDDIVIFGQNQNPYLDNYNPHFQNRSEKNVKKIQAFYMDKYEVTNQEYYTFCKDTNRRLPPSWIKNQSYPAQKADHPVNVTSYQDVMAYANWSGKQIPTEFEWELAARGGYRSLIKSGMDYTEAFQDPNIYPGSNKFRSESCNTVENGLKRTMSVYELKDISIFGIVGMCGNAREWTSSWYTLYPGNSMFKSGSLFGKVFKVIRGGSFAQNKNYARSDFRDYGGFPTLSKDHSAGFRLIIRK